MNGFDYAVQMEVDGEKFYREQALLNKDNVLNPVFLSLAEDEKKHAQMIKEKQMGQDSLTDQEIVVDTKNVFTSATGMDADKIMIDQIDAYKKALEMEQKSIDLYKKLLAESQDEKDFFEFLIKQEEKHYQLIDEIIVMVNRPNEWVESAEFGVRKKY